MSHLVPRSRETWSKHYSPETRETHWSGGFTFGGSDPPYSILAVQAEKDGITTISGQLMGKSLSILHIVVTHSLPTP